MSNESLLEEFRNDVSSLKYKDEDHLDKVIRKGKMLIRNIYGDPCDYLNDFNNIVFYPSFAPSGEDYQHECWERGKSSIINLINTMLEEASLFGATTSSNGNEADNVVSTLNRVFIVHGHDENAKINVDYPAKSRSRSKAIT